MKRNKLQENAPDPTGNTEHGWMWRIHCPSCSDPVVLAMPDSGMKKMRTLLQRNVGSDGRTAEIWGGGRNVRKMPPEELNQVQHLRRRGTGLRPGI